MATTPLSLATDPSKINPAGAQQADLDEYQRSLDEQIKSLEARYANPNWFKVAAGFAKPQLGGFMASFGSAAEALGENVEQQRAAALPIAQMRSQQSQGGGLAAAAGGGFNGGGDQQGQALRARMENLMRSVLTPEQLRDSYKLGCTFAVSPGSTGRLLGAPGTCSPKVSWLRMMLLVAVSWPLGSTT